MASISPPRQPTARETAASFGVLAALVAVCVWLALAQRHFSPAVTVAASAAASANNSPPAQQAAGRQPAGAPAPAADFVPPLPPGLHAMNPAESFTAETLSDKIDGKAELYLSAGVVGMRCQRVAVTPRADARGPAGAPPAWFEAFAYDMGTPENAFSVYSSQKRTATSEAGIGDYGYIAGNQVCVVHGQYYLEFVGADDSAATRDGALALARAFIAGTLVSRHANMARDEALFPAEGLQPGAIMLMSADVFGFDELTNTYVARYRAGPDMFTLFLSRRADAAEAARLAVAVRRFFVDDCGGHEVAAPDNPTGAVIVDEGGTFDGVFASGAFVAGVHQAPTREAAEQSLRQLGGRLQGAPR